MIREHAANLLWAARRRATRLKLAAAAALLASTPPREIRDILREKRGDAGEVLALAAVAFMQTMHAELGSREQLRTRISRDVARRIDESRRTWSRA